jgi:hypothetical protein
MDKVYIIVKNKNGNPKIPVRWGLRGDGECGYCLHRGQIVCFTSFEEANRVLMSFTDPDYYYYDIIEYSATQHI